MHDFTIIEPHIDPNNRPGFLIDWELTMKCNLDCVYCGTGLYGGHDNTTAHPPLHDCFSAVDFMLQYVDLHMKRRTKGIKYVHLNVYGGESLHHPNIVEILKYVHDQYKKYQTLWHLTVTVTTNLILNDSKLQKILPFIHEFTASFHAQNTEKQLDNFKNNLLTIKSNGTRVKVVVMMHNDLKLFDKCKMMISWCQDHQLRYLVKQIDHNNSDDFFSYTSEQVKWFDNVYSQKTKNSIRQKLIKIQDNDKKVNLAHAGRACCGGRQLCVDKDYKNKQYFVNNKFKNWYCSVNHFFVYIKQLTGEIFVNKDCKMNYQGKIGAIGKLQHYQELLDWTAQMLKQQNLPIIQCQKDFCLCGLCAPKSLTLDQHHQIMEKYLIS